MDASQRLTGAFSPYCFQVRSTYANVAMNATNADTAIAK